MNLSDKMKFFETLPDDDKNITLEYLCMLFFQFLPDSGLNEPIYLFIDNCVIQDVIKHDVSHESKLKRCAVNLFGCFLNDYSGLDYRVVLSPVILYEAGSRKVFTTEKEFNMCLEKTKVCLSMFKSSFYTLGFRSYTEAISLIECIIHDEKQITNAIETVKKSNWTLPLRDGSKIMNPFALSHSLLPDDIDLKYFKRFYVNMIVAALIERLILENSENDKKARATFKGELVKVFASLNKIKKGALKGLGDIELLQYCDTTSQFQNNHKTTFTALTFDVNLAKALSSRKGLPVTHTPISGTDGEAEIKNKLAELEMGVRHLEAIALKESQVAQRVYEFLKILQPTL